MPPQPQPQRNPLSLPLIRIEIRSFNDISALTPRILRRLRSTPIHLHRRSLSGSALIGTILGSVFGALVVIGIILVVTLVVLRRRRRRNNRGKETLSSTDALNAPASDHQQKRRSWGSSMWGADTEAEVQGEEGYKEAMRGYHSRNQRGEQETGNENESGGVGVRREGTVARKEREKKAKSASSGLWWMGGGQKSPRILQEEGEGEKSPKRGAEGEEGERTPPLPVTPLWKKEVGGSGEEDTGDASIRLKELEGG